MRISDWSSDVCSSDLIMAAIVNEGAGILDEGVAQRAADIDITYVYGYGFPRYRGGPMFWAQSEGIGRILELVRQQYALHPRWKPADMLVEAAAKGSWSR